MTEFCRTFPDRWMDILTSPADQPGWWRDILDYRFRDIAGFERPLILAVRKDYLNAYVEGQSVMRIRFDNKTEPKCLQAEIHYKYLGGEYRVFDGQKIDCLHYLDKKSLDQWIKRAQGFAKPKPGNDPFSEKQSVAVIAANHPHVIDVEMALPGLTAPRIDLVALEGDTSAIKIVFYEAKLFSNSALRAKEFPPKVVEQLGKYETWLASSGREDEVTKAYRNACGLLTRLWKMQGVPVDRLVELASRPDSPLTVDRKPRLIIFGPHTIGNWLHHEERLEKAGIAGTRLIIKEHPKDVSIPGDMQV